MNDVITWPLSVDQYAAIRVGTALLSLLFLGLAAMRLIETGRLLRRRPAPATAAAEVPMDERPVARIVPPAAAPSVAALPDPPPPAPAPPEPASPDMSQVEVPVAQDDQESDAHDLFAGGQHVFPRSVSVPAVGYRWTVDRDRSTPRAAPTEDDAASIDEPAAIETEAAPIIDDPVELPRSPPEVPSRTDNETLAAFLAALNDAPETRDAIRRFNLPVHPADWSADQIDEALRVAACHEWLSIAGVPDDQMPFVLAQLGGAARASDARLMQVMRAVAATAPAIGNDTLSRVATTTLIEAMVGLDATMIWPDIGSSAHRHRLRDGRTPSAQDIVAAVRCPGIASSSGTVLPAVIEIGAIDGDPKPINDVRSRPTPFLHLLRERSMVP